MKISKERPEPLPLEIVLRFPVGEGWAVAAALREYADSHPQASHRDSWRSWAADLDRFLRDGER